MFSVNGYQALYSSEYSEKQNQNLFQLGFTRGTEYILQGESGMKKCRKAICSQRSQGSRSKVWSSLHTPVWVCIKKLKGLFWKTAECVLDAWRQMFKPCEETFGKPIQSSQLTAQEEGVQTEARILSEIKT